MTLMSYTSHGKTVASELGVLVQTWLHRNAEYLILNVHVVNRF